MASKPISKPPLMMDPKAFIRGASAPPAATTIIGDKAEELQEQLAAPAPAPVQEAPEPKAHPARTSPVRASKHDSKPMPWDDANPRVKSYVQVRMPEPLGIKLKYVKDRTPGVSSLHDLVLSTLEEMVEKRLAEILKEESTGSGK